MHEPIDHVPNREPCTSPDEITKKYIYQRDEPKQPHAPANDQAFDAARLEEEYNVERWGMIEGGHDMDRGNTTLTLTAASTLIWLRKGELPTPAL